MLKKIKSSGFTVIELLIVIVVIGILATLALNAIGDAQRRARNAQRVDTAKRWYTGLIAYATENNDLPAPINRANSSSTEICLGDYPDLSGDSIGDCRWAVNGYDIKNVDTSFNTTMNNYLGAVPSLGGEVPSGVEAIGSFVGATILHDTALNINSEPAHYLMVYWLEGEDQDCGIPGLVTGGSWPNYTSDTSTTSSAWVPGGGTQCYVHFLNKLDFEL